MEKEFDLRVVAHAKDYIDDLARGINPLTKGELAETDIVNNVKISRCLFYVSDVLSEVIENGGIKTPKKVKKIPFALEGVDLSRFEFIEKPLNVSDLVGKINDLRPENMSKLKITAVTDWLVDLKLLEVLIFNDKTRKFPTPTGEKMGIIKEERTGPHGSYSVVLYTEKAQRFIVDNLSAVIDGGYNATKSKE